LKPTTNGGKGGDHQKKRRGVPQAFVLLWTGEVESSAALSANRISKKGKKGGGGCLSAIQNVPRREGEGKDKCEKKGKYLPDKRNMNSGPTVPIL